MVYISVDNPNDFSNGQVYFIVILLPTRVHLLVMNIMECMHFNHRRCHFLGQINVLFVSFLVGILQIP